MQQQPEYTGTQYATLQAAYTAANNGDEIYLHGSGTTYSLNSSQNFAKQLTITGNGVYPNKPTVASTKIQMAGNAT